MGFKMDNAVLLQNNAYQGSAFQTHHVAQIVGSVNPALDCQIPVHLCHQLPHAKIQLSGIQETVQSHNIIVVIGRLNVNSH